MFCVFVVLIFVRNYANMVYVVFREVLGFLDAQSSRIIIELWQKSFLDPKHDTFYKFTKDVKFDPSGS